MASPAGRAAVVATLAADPAAAGGSALRRPPPEVSGLEVRADLAGEVDPGRLRRQFAGELCYTLRSVAEGGGFAGPPQARWERLLTAADHYDVIDLEADRDLVPAVLDRIPPDRRRISWHGRAAADADGAAGAGAAGPTDAGAGDPLDRLAARFDRMAATPARYYLLAPAAASGRTALAALRLLTRLRRTDVTAFGTGPAGVWSRVLAPWLGAPVVFGRLDDRVPPDVPTVEQIRTDYPLPELPPLRFLAGLVGRSVAGSMSPRLHNAAYRTLGLPGLFLPFQADDLHRFWSEVGATGLDRLGIPLRGVTVTSPHKAAALDVADTVAPVVDWGRSANALVRRDSGWRAEASEGAVAALARAGVPLAGRKAAVLGCGGAGRTIAVGLLRAGAQPVLVNRGTERGRQAAAILRLPFVPLAEFSPVGCTLVVSAIPGADRPALPVWDLPDDAVVLDLVYRPHPTDLIAAARSRGLTTVDGLEVLRLEVAQQFRLITGAAMPELPADPRQSVPPAPPSPAPIRGVP